MQAPSFRVKRNGVPILSKAEINEIGEYCISQCQPEVLEKHIPVDIDAFAEFYLNNKIDYQYLSHNGIYLGMTVFNDTNKIPIYNPATHTAEYISEKAGTIIIDRRLLEDNQNHRYRFTMGHECGHTILHPYYFYYKANQLSLCDDNLPMIKCRIDAGMNSKSDTNYWSDTEWMEWQANHLSAAILMPKCVLDEMSESYMNKLDDPFTRAKLVYEISNGLDVSYEAATYRIKELYNFSTDGRSDLLCNRAIFDFPELLHA